ncbi:hypothetical protein MKX01_020559, partial [Papaver californicum]
MDHDNPHLSCICWTRDVRGSVSENDKDLMALICFWYIVNARKRHPEHVHSGHILNISTCHLRTHE